MLDDVFKKNLCARMSILYGNIQSYDAWSHVSAKIVAGPQLKTWDIFPFYFDFLSGQLFE